ncbi:MAG: hypothetical protein PHQ19_00615 [Candidatus Krumholzibacteria bacterium]|nr:hypothetical protein [Candidatus Krumholzibacteria bacterium]
MSRIVTASVFAVLLLLPAALSAQSCDALEFTVSAEPSTDPGFEGWYKYTVSGYWAVSGVEEGGGLSNFLFSLGMECPCLCDPDYDAEIGFPAPAGTSTGEYDDAPCDNVEYIGEAECGGYEDITTDDVIKFEVLAGECEPVDSGTGTWVFYSTLPPLDDAVYGNAVMIKYGEMTCWGDLSGQLPDCWDCISVGTSEQSWGATKTIYR